jgi:CBS domain-containing protein
LRSLLALWLEPLRATRIAATISRIIAIVLGIYGFVSLSPFLMAIAFFVYTAVQAETQQALINNRLGNQKVRDLMSRDPITVEPEMPLSQFVQLMFFKKHHAYPVVDKSGKLLGFARPQDAQENSSHTVASIMKPAETLPEDLPALEALKRMAESPLGRFAVLNEQGAIVGILSKTDVIRVLQPNP